MLNQIVGPLFIWLAATFSQTERLAADESLRFYRRDIPKRWIGILMIVVASAGLCWQVYQAWKTSKEIKVAKQEVRELREANSKLFNEASGGAVVKDLAYVVDDEKPVVFVFRLDGDYRLIDKIELKEKGAIVTGEEVDDLEAIAGSNGKLYLITSYSNNKKGKPNAARQRLLEVSLEPGTRGEITNSANDLRKAISKTILGDSPADSNKLAASYKNEKNADEVMQIEGLAIDQEGNAYLGLRAPLTTEGDYALVLSAKLSDLFSTDKEPEFKVFRLSLWHKNENDSEKYVPYGIVSLDYDAKNKMMVILGNSSTNSGYFSPILCQWNYAGEHRDDRIQQPDCSPVPGYNLSGSTSRTSKIELLLLPTESRSDRVFAFLDTDDKGNGGQLSYTRSELGLERSLQPGG